MQTSPLAIPPAIPDLPKGKNTSPVPFGIRLAPRPSALGPSSELLSDVSTSSDIGGGGRIGGKGS